MQNFFSLEGVFKTRNMVVIALMTALSVVLSQFSIYITPTFRLISFTYLSGAVVSMLYGPWAGIAFGLLSDTVTYIAKPGGPYFVGYAISEMVSNFIYACFLYRKPLRIWRVLLARTVIMLLVTLGLSYLWNVIMYGSVASTYFTSVRLINNLLQLPVSVALIVCFARLAMQLEKTGLTRS